MLKILQARLQQYVNHELPDVQAEFRKGRGPRDQTANIHWIIKKQENSGKTSISALLTMPKPLTGWIMTNCGEFLQETGIADHLTCLLRNLYAGQEATVRTRHGTTELFQIGNVVCQVCILSPYLFNRVRHVKCWADKAQAEIKIAGRNINNLRYADDTTLTAERKEELKSLLMNVREENETVGLKLSIQKTKFMACGSIT